MITRQPEPLLFGHFLKPLLVLPLVFAGSEPVQPRHNPLENDIEHEQRTPENDEGKHQSNHGPHRSDPMLRMGDRAQQNDEAGAERSEQAPEVCAHVFTHLTQLRAHIANIRADLSEDRLSVSCDLLQHSDAGCGRFLVSQKALLIRVRGQGLAGFRTPAGSVLSSRKSRSNPAHSVHRVNA